MTYFSMLIIVFTCFLLPACHGKKEEATSQKILKIREPKTTYGKAVHSADRLSAETDKQNDELKKQADAIFDGPQ